ncbi:MAG: HEAT repeat domain-containing protein [Planctomycetota bacterium]|nr:HEAT repeat domain-containing protein [Planctomycetota bacterium]
MRNDRNLAAACARLFGAVLAVWLLCPSLLLALDAEQDPFKPKPEDLKVEVVAPKKVLAYDAAAAVTLRLNNVSRRAFSIDRAQIYLYMSLEFAWPGRTVAGAQDAKRFLKSTPFEKEDAERLAKLEPGAALELPLELASIAREAVGEVEVKLSLSHRRAAYWGDAVVWEGRSPRLSCKVEYETPKLLTLMRPAEAPKPGEVKRAVLEILDGPERSAEWLSLAFRGTAPISADPLVELFEAGRDDALEPLRGILATSILTSEHKKEVQARFSAALARRTAGAGPWRDGMLSAYLRIAAERPAPAQLLRWFGGAGPEDRVALLGELLKDHPEAQATADACLAAWDEAPLRPRVLALLTGSQAPASVARLIFLQRQGVDLAVGVARRADPLDAELQDAFAALEAPRLVEVLRALLGLGPKRAVGPSQRAFAARVARASASADVRRAAVLAAGLPPEPDAALLAERAEKDADAVVRGFARALLALSRGDALPPPRIRAIVEARWPEFPALPDANAALAQAENARERPGAELLAVAYATGAEHLPRLRKLLAHAQPDLASAAVEAAGRLRDAESEPALLDLLRRPREGVSPEAVQRALLRIGGREGLAALQAAPKPLASGLSRALAGLTREGARCDSELPWLDGRFLPAWGVELCAYGVGRTEIVPADLGQPFILLVHARKADGAAEWHAQLPGRPQHAFGPFHALKTGEPEEHYLSLDEELDAGRYEVGFEALALFAGRWDEPSFTWAGREGKAPVFVPGFGLARLKAGPLDFEVKHRNPPAGARPRVWGTPGRVRMELALRMGAAEAAEYFLAPLKELNLRFGRDEEGRLRGWRTGMPQGPHYGSQSAVGPILELARAGRPEAVAFALRARESEDPYTAWHGTAALRLFQLRTQAEGGREAAAAWLAELYAQPEDFFVGYQRLVPELCALAGPERVKEVAAKAARDAAQPWMRLEARGLAEGKGDR